MLAAKTSTTIAAVVVAALTWISQTRTYQGGEPGRHLHFSGTQDLVCW